MTNTQQQFIESFNTLATEAHETSVSKGWWENSEADALEAIAETPDLVGMNANALRTIASKLKAKNDGEMIALMHSELSEALEALRHGNPPDDKIPSYSGVEAEFCDVIIRIMDLAAARGWRVAEALVAKMTYNQSRSHKHGGKQF